MVRTVSVQFYSMMWCKQLLPYTDSSFLSVKANKQTVVNQHSCRFNPCLNQTFQFLDLFCDHSCLRGFDWQECNRAVLCPQCLQCAVKNKQKQIFIHSEHIRVPSCRWCAFNFAQIENQVPSWSIFSNNDAKLAHKKIWFWKKGFN